MVLIYIRGFCNNGNKSALNMRHNGNMLNEKKNVIKILKSKTFS